VSAIIKIGRGATNAAELMIIKLLDDGNPYGENIKFSITGADSVLVEIVRVMNDGEKTVSDFINYKGSFVAGLIAEELTVSNIIN
jgi:hypothetical protein